MSLKIAVDFDGTCTKTMDAVCHLINFKHHTNYTSKDITTWDWWKDNGFEEDFWRAYDFFDKSGFRQFLEPYDDMVPIVLRGLSTCRFYDVDIVTCNMPNAKASVEAWLNRNVPGHDIDVKAIGRVHPKHKASLDYDVFLDDSPGLAEQFVRDWPRNRNKTLIIANARWNEKPFEQDSPNIGRFRSWSQIPGMIDRIYGFKHTHTNKRFWK